MTFRGKVHDGVELMITKQGLYKFGVVDVGNDQLALVIEHAFKVGAIASVGQCIDDNDRIVGMNITPIANKVSTNKSRSAGDEHASG